MNRDDQVLAEIKAELKELRKDVNRLLNFEEFKKESKSNFINFIRVAAIVISLVMTGIGFLTYEIGLYKPIPHNQKVNK